MHLEHDSLGSVRIARDGPALIAEARLASAFPRPPLHVHPRQSERFEVHDGRLRLTVGRAELVLSSGDAVTVPAGVPHTFATGGGPVEMRATFDRAGELERFFAGLHRLVQDGHIDARGRPRSLAVAAFALEHLHDFRLARAPAGLQRAALAALARFAAPAGGIGSPPCAPSPSTSGATAIGSSCSTSSRRPSPRTGCSSASTRPG